MCLGVSNDWPESEGGGREGGRKGRERGREGGREGGKEVEEAVQALLCALNSPPTCISSRYPMPTQEASTTHIYIKS